MYFFGPKSIFFGRKSQFFVTNSTDQQKTNLFVLVQLQFGRKGGRWDRKMAFLAQKGPF
jgi:hypothetical protein